MIIVGIDPGLTGAIAAFNDDTGRVVVRDVCTRLAGEEKSSRTVKREICPDATMDALTESILAASGGVTATADLAVIEAVGSRPGEGSASAFSFGDTSGTLRALGEIVSLRLMKPTPATWKRHFGLTSDKDGSRDLATALLPGNGLDKILKRKKDHDRAEAILLALYGSQMEIFNDGG